MDLEGFSILKSSFLKCKYLWDGLYLVPSWASYIVDTQLSKEDSKYWEVRPVASERYWERRKQHWQKSWGGKEKPRLLLWLCLGLTLARPLRITLGATGCRPLIYSPSSKYEQHVPDKKWATAHKWAKVGLCSSTIRKGLKKIINIHGWKRIHPQSEQGQKSHLPCGLCVVIRFDPVCLLQRSWTHWVGNHVVRKLES